MFKGKLYDYHPPSHKEYLKQDHLTDSTVEEIKKLRKPPKYKYFQKFLHILLFIIFGIPKMIFSLCFLLTAGLLFVLLTFIWRSIGKPLLFKKLLMVYWVSFARILLFLLGFLHINYHGEYNKESRFLVSNHICFFDQWLFLPFYPRPLDKKETLSLPILKDMCEIFDGISVDRSKPNGLTKELLKNAQNTIDPQILLMPEGCSTSGDYMLRFHLGAFLSDLPVQPAAIRYTLWGTNRKLSHLSFFQNNLYQFVIFLGIPFITIDVFFLEVVSIKGNTENDRRNFAYVFYLKIFNKLCVKFFNFF